MIREIVRAEAAEEDITAIIDYFIECADSDVALRFAGNLQTITQCLAEMPGVGSLRRYPTSMQQEFRVVAVPGFPNHLIFYYATADQLKVVRVIHGARDIEAAFADMTNA